MTASIFPIWILSAGQGSRVGQSKGLQLINGIPWLEHIIKQYARAGGTSVWIVLGADVGSYYQELPWLPQSDVPAQYEGITIHVVINHDWQQGQFSSIQHLARLCSEELPVWILPVDCILPRREVLQELQQFYPDYKVVIPTYDNRGGHPVLIDSSIWQKFTEMDLDDPMTRLDTQLRQLSHQLLYRHQVDDRSVLSNMNTIDDWKVLDE